MGDAGGVLTALDVVETGTDHIVVDLTCDAVDSDVAPAVAAAVRDASRTRT
ncbi:hypothetical protein [Streptomyces sp. Rer75]|uniref:hypothetical protein n=1 Tax=unclassified Streptomyces TaxID=2593676 RepID=UPI0015D026C2|nr:hypothetical protein [Streptomyces sp. Rer75]QLH20165.1 hypothetical protein HYQ63_05485 [Streptomyces sp. Rer75]